MPPRRTSSANDDIPFGDRGEAAWEQLSRHAAWAEQFWLVFVFAPSEMGPRELQRRLAMLLKKEGKDQVVLRPDAPDELPSLLYQIGNTRSEGAHCIWIDAVRRDISAHVPEEDAWVMAWDSFLLRANERREVLRDAIEGGLILCAPTELKPRFRDAAPDLWSIRSLVLELDDPIVRDRGIPVQRDIVSETPDAEMAMKEAERLKDHHPTARLARAHALIRAGRGYLALNKQEAAVLTAEEIVTLVSEMKTEFEHPSNNATRTSQVRALIGLGEILLRLNRFDESMLYLREALDLSHIHRGEDPSNAVSGGPAITQSELSALYNDLSLIEKARGNLEEADRLLRRAIDIDRKLGDRKNLASRYSNLSLIEKDRGQLENAERWLKKAIALDEETGDRQPLARRYTNMALIEQARGHLLDAKHWLEKAMTLDEELGDKPSLAICYHNLGRIEKARGQFDNAEHWLKEAIAIGEELRDRTGLAFRYNDMSQIELDRGDLASAEAWLARAWKMTGALPGSKLRQDVGKAYANVLQSRGKNDEALEVQEKILHPVQE